MPFSGGKRRTDSTSEVAPICNEQARRLLGVRGQRGARVDGGAFSSARINTRADQRPDRCVGRYGGDQLGTSAQTLAAHQCAPSPEHDGTDDCAILERVAFLDIDAPNVRERQFSRLSLHKYPHGIATEFDEPSVHLPP